MESLNNFTTIEYFQASNKHDDYLKQMMCRRLRIDRFKFQKDISELIAISDENTSSASDSDSEDINSWYMISTWQKFFFTHICYHQSSAKPN